MDKDFKFYMDTLEESATKTVALDMRDLIHILRLLENQYNRQEFNDLRKGLWFRQAYRQFPKSNGNQLIELINVVFTEIPDHEKHFNGFFHHWEHAMLKKIPDLTDPVSILKTYTQHNRDLPEEMVIEWCKSMIRKIDTMDTNQSVEIMNQFAALKVRPEQEFMQRWCRKMESMITGKRLNSNQLATVAYSCGKLDITELKSPLTNALKDSSIFSSMNADQLIKTVYGCILLKINIRNDLPQLTTHFFDALKSNMHGQNAKSLSIAIWSAGRLAHAQIPHQFITNWSSQFMNKINDLNAQNLNLTLEGLKLLQDSKYEIPANVKSAWLNRADQMISDFWPQTLPRILIDLHRLNAQVRLEFVRKCLQVIKDHLEHIYASDYANILISLAGLDIKPDRVDPEFMPCWKSEATRHGKYERWSPSLKSELRQALEKLGIRIDRDLEKMLD